MRRSMKSPFRPAELPDPASPRYNTAPIGGEPIPPDPRASTTPSEPATGTMGTSKR